jgi:hypothetical protein
MAEGEWSNHDIQDPLSSMFTFLAEKRDRKLTQHWGIWLTKRDPERALQVQSSLSELMCQLTAYQNYTYQQLLTSRDTTKRRDKPEDDLLTLQQVTDANAVAGIQFLEHLVLQKRSLVSFFLSFRWCTLHNYVCIRTQIYISSWQIPVSISC